MPVPNSGNTTDSVFAAAARRMLCTVSCMSCVFLVLVGGMAWNMCSNPCWLRLKASVRSTLQKGRGPLAAEIRSQAPTNPSPPARLMAPAMPLTCLLRRSGLAELTRPFVLCALARMSPLQTSTTVPLGKRALARHLESDCHCWPSWPTKEAQAAVSRKIFSRITMPGSLFRKACWIGFNSTLSEAMRSCPSHRLMLEAA
mmetsp:Transcript_61010/g.133538  ORF Transcript_61010/g.133538 Transcript_61010/m.133538 type:complete len:200 (+) Transcript_61010:148-747(+)